MIQTEFRLIQCGPGYGYGCQIRGPKRNLIGMYWPSYKDSLIPPNRYGVMEELANNLVILANERFFIKNVLNMPIDYIAWPKGDEWVPIPEEEVVSKLVKEFNTAKMTLSQT